MNEEKLIKELRHIDNFKQFDVNQEWSAFLEKTQDLKDNKAVLTSLADENKSAKVRKLPFAIISTAAAIAVLIGVFFIMDQPDDALQSSEVVVEEPVIIEQTPPVIKEEPIVVQEKRQLDIVQVDTEPNFINVDADKVFHLDDGSKINFITVSSIAFAETFKGLVERVIHLHSGEVKFDVAKDENRPFTVITNNSGISVTGTIFRVAKSGEDTTVKTLEGVVELYSVENEDIRKTVNAGQEYSFDGENFQEIVPVEEAKVEAEPVDEGIKGMKITLEVFSKNVLFKDKIQIKTKVLKGVKDEIFILPSDINPSKNEDIDRIILSLKNQFEAEIEERDGCESCYKVLSIKKKSN